MYELKKINSIKVSNFLIYEKYIYIYNEFEKIIYKLKEDYNFEIFLQDSDLFYLSIQGNLIHIINNKFYNIAKQKVIFLREVLFDEGDYLECIGLNDSQVILKNFKKDGTLEMYKVNEDLHTVSRINYIGNVFLIIDNVSIELYEGGIQIVNILFGKKILKHSYSELTGSNKANLHSQVLNSDSKLFFVITGNDKKGRFALDIETGDVLKKFDNLCYEIFKDGGYIYTTKFENILCRINTRTLELEEWDCNALIVKNDFHSIHDHRCNVIDGKFCFTQSLGDNKSKLGVLDWEKKELVYKYNFEPGNGAIGSIQVNNTRMFVLTQDNTLHILEKEEKSI